MKLTHPREGYTGPVVTASGRRVWFLDGDAEATNLSAAEKSSFKAAGFRWESPRAKGDAEASDQA